MRAKHLFFPVLLLACASDAPRPAAQRSTSSDETPSTLLGCEDVDGDGFGPMCAPGEDCDDEDPAVTDACYRCIVPNQGCTCEMDARPAACDVDTNGQVTMDTCYVGQRTCMQGVWTRCIAYAPRFN